MPTKVLLCSPKGITGGISQWTNYILSYATTKTSAVTVNWFYPMLAEGQLVSNLSIIKRIIRGLKIYLPFINDLKAHINKHHYDIAHFSTSGGISFVRDYYALKACKKRGIKTILHLHFGRIPQILLQNSLEKILFKRLIKITDTFIAIDKSTYDSLLEYGLTNVQNLPNPLSPTIANIIASLPDCSRSQNTVLFVGHVLRTKGIYELTKACSAIPNIYLEIFGHCDDIVRNDILQQVPKDFHDHIEFRGNCDIKDVIQAMKSCTIFVLPSYSEGFPNVILEAMAAGCAIVATPVGAIPQMLEEKNGKQYGVFVKPKDSISLSTTISSLLDDEKLKSELRKNVQKRVSERYNIESIWAELANIWTSL